MKRRAAVASVVGIVAILGVASFAWACTTFSTLKLSTSAGPPGTEVVVTGENAAAGKPVALRWNSRSATKVAEVTADEKGSFSVPVKVPGGGGAQFLIATDGNGDIARAAFEVSADGLVATQAGFRADPAPATNWLELGVRFLSLALLAAVPVAGGLVLMRRPAAVGAES